MSKQFQRISKLLQGGNIYEFSAIKADALKVIDEKRMPAGVKSAVIFLMPYYTGEHKNRNVSLYAVSRDYHLYVKELGAAFESDGEHFYSIFADTSPIDERSAALRAGLGVKGRNGLVINERYGSYVFIGTILTDAVFDEEEYVQEKAERQCAGCGLCEKNCAYLRGETDICLSELNQRKSVTDTELEIIRKQSLVWGCDTCQQACPHNEQVCETPVEFFKKDLLETLDVPMIEAMSKKEFSKRAYSWRGKKTILRNLGVDN